MAAAALDLKSRDPLAPAPPPTQDELPWDDGEPMETPKHREQMNLLIHSLQRWLAGREDVYVGGNMALYYSDLQARNQDFKAPDFFVVLDATPASERPDRQRKSWVVWEEDGRTPDVVIELLSESTEREDRGRKMRIYASLNVGEYYLYDPVGGLLEGYRLTGRAYAPMTPRSDGDLDCTVLGLRLGVVDGSLFQQEGPWLRWKTPQGELLRCGEEEAELQRARADQERARAERLAAKLRELGLDPEV